MNAEDEEEMNVRDGSSEGLPNSSLVEQAQEEEYEEHFEEEKMENPMEEEKANEEGEKKPEHYRIENL